MSRVLPVERPVVRWEEQWFPESLGQARYIFVRYDLVGNISLIPYLPSALIPRVVSGFVLEQIPSASDQKGKIWVHLLVE